LIHQKDRTGQRLMMMMAKPRKPHKDEAPGLYWFDDEARLQQLYDYCKKDVEVERELYLQLQPLIPDELKLWQLDCIINARGFHFDRKLAEAARKIARALGPELNAELAQLTAGAVSSIHQVAKLKNWLAAQGCTTKALDKAAIEELLGSKQVPATVRRVLELRQGGAQAAAKKIDALLARR